MDALERTIRIVAEITYKPTWEFSVAAVPHFGSDGSLLPIRMLCLYARLTAPDVTNPENTVHISSFRQLPYEDIDGWSDELLIQYVRDFVRSAEMHEVDEWFRFRGIPLVNPHPELAVDPRPPKPVPLLRPGEIAPAGY